MQPKAQYKYIIDIKYPHIVDMNYKKYLAATNSVDHDMQNTEE